MAALVSQFELEATAKTIEARGIMAEDEAQIHQRLVLACQGVMAEQSDLALKDYLLPFLDGVKAALHKEFCDPEKKALRDAYQKYFANAMTTNGVTAVAAVVTKVVAVVNPAFAVSTVAVYLALWVLKVGINHWCSLPTPSPA
jgi:hypothetical protein